MVSGQLHVRATLPQGERAPGTHRIGGWVGSRAGLVTVDKIKISPCRERKPECPTCRPSLYQLSFILTFIVGGFEISICRNDILLYGLKKSTKFLRKTFVTKTCICSYLLFENKFLFIIPQISTGYGLDDRGVGVRVTVGSRIFSFPSRPERLWGTPNLLSNCNGGKAAGA
jgi:hypothetical protein